MAYSTCTVVGNFTFGCHCCYFTQIKLQREKLSEPISAWTKKGDWLSWHNFLSTIEVPLSKALNLQQFRVVHHFRQKCLRSGNCNRNNFCI